MTDLFDKVLELESEFLAEGAKQGQADGVKQGYQEALELVSLPRFGL